MRARDLEVVDRLFMSDTGVVGSPHFTEAVTRDLGGYRDLLMVFGYSEVITSVTVSGTGVVGKGDFPVPVARYSTGF